MRVVLVSVMVLTLAGQVAQARPRRPALIATDPVFPLRALVVDARTAARGSILQVTAGRDQGLTVGMRGTLLSTAGTFRGPVEVIKVHENTAQVTSYVAPNAMSGTPVVMFGTAVATGR